MEKKPISPVEVLQESASTILQEPVKLVVDIFPQGRIQKVLQRCGLLPRKKEFLIRPITLGNLIRISKLLLAIDLKGYEKRNLLDINFKLIDQHGLALARIVAIAIHNRRSEPPRRLVSFVQHQFTSKELSRTVLIVLKQMDLSSFTSTIISAKGLTVMSPEPARS